MIARGTAALFAHLVHCRQFRFLWAISLTGDKCGMGLQRWEALWLLPPQNDSRCWTAYYPAIGISNWGWYGNVLCLLCFQHTEGLPDTPEPQGMRLGRLSKGSGIWFCSSICLCQMKSIDLPARPWMLPKCMSFCSSVTCSRCRSGFQLLSPANFEQLLNWFTG